MSTITEALQQAKKLCLAGNYLEAERLCRQVLQLDPGQPDAVFILGFVYRKCGRLELARQALTQAVASSPLHAVYHGNLGMVLQQMGRLPEAVARYQDAVRLQPIYPEIHNNLSLALKELGQLDDAVSAAQEAIRQRPDFADAFNNLGVALAARNDPGQAEIAYRQALRLNPVHALALNNLGNVLSRQGMLDEAIQCMRDVVRLQPDFALAQSNLGGALAAQGMLDQAVPCYQQALAINPGLAEAHLNLGLALLAQGDFARGWPEYEWRWKQLGIDPRYLSRPSWDGSPLAGRTILLHGEQGLGDTLQFIRYAPLVKQRGGRVLVCCQPSLIRLLARCPGVDQVVAPGESLPEFDVTTYLLKLPAIFGTTVATVPADVPYLFPDDALVERWRGQLNGGFKVGMVWQGSPTHTADRQRSVPLSRFAPLAKIEGVRLFSLQKDRGRDQLLDAKESFPVIDLGGVTSDDFVDMAAVVKSLDLVISVDTAPAHLAGALGVPVWLALPFAADWRWLQHRQDSPWYPTMRLFRQPTLGDWGSVFEQIRGALQITAHSPQRHKEHQAKDKA